ncbi:hypothetical protein GOP47_0016474 [Adiantum capillus-veneris]|uniref:starch synthase n=1 Tax=Adiantum capillus-veneris TaxID=13818 RepID=A0A9D4UIJ4_ADICA|nr:hypothetical protein GOP47_0016474 [Adiantum capillus-veneris]
MAFCSRLNASNSSAIAFPSSPARHRHPLAAARASNSSNQANGVDTFKSQEGAGSKSTSSCDVMKLFNDVQQNMLFLNKQRIDALDGLQRVEREKEILAAKLSLLEAEVEATVSERDMLKQELQDIKAIAGEGRGMQNGKGNTGIEGYAMPSPVFSELLLRIDSMVLTGAINIEQASRLKSLVSKQDAQAAKTFLSLEPQGDKELAFGLLPLLDPNRRFGLHITHICTELDPIAISGAIGNFVLNLSRALQRKGNLVEVILPKYATMNMDAVQNLRDMQVDFRSFFGGQWHRNKIWTGVVHGIAVTFIESLHPGGFFLRDHFYNYSDDFERFSYFCRAALDYILKSGKQPDILHLHNWQTALVAPMFWELFASQGSGDTRIVFTCNTFKYQCLQEPAKLGLCGLDPVRLHRADRLQDIVQPNFVNILKGGIVFSNKVTTMSSAYAYDLDHGHGLQSTFMAHKNKLLKVFNGLDVTVWNPAIDANLPSRYSSEDLSGKVSCKRHLKQQLGLSSNDSIPLVGCLASQVSDSDLELIRATLNCSVMKGAEFVVMGESKIAELQIEFEEKGGKIIKSKDDSMAHLLMAASDIVICMLVDEEAAELPLIAMQYGSVPIIKQQEASEGSVKDADDVSRWMDANAFIYRSGTPQDLMVAVIKAIDCSVNDPERWKQLMRNGMSKDFSWDGECVEAYVSAYMSMK